MPILSIFKMQDCLFTISYTLASQQVRALEISLS